MRRALLRDEDRVPEMTVVRNEFERGENSPFQVLYKQTFATAFREHPYHHPTIGWRSDIEGVSTARLREFYDTFYHPNNATAMLIGDFEEADALAAIERQFGAIPPSPQPIPRSTPSSRRRKASAASSCAAPARSPGAVCRGGRSRRGMPTRRRSRCSATSSAAASPSRLHQALVEKSLALSVTVVPWQLRDPALFSVFAPVRPGVEPSEVEAVIRQEIARVAADSVTEAECEKARTQIEAEVIFDRDSTDQIAASLSEAIAVADWEWYADYPKAIRRVTPADVQRVVLAYLHDDALTVGLYLPRPAAAGEAPPTTTETPRRDRSRRGAGAPVLRRSRAHTHARQRRPTLRPREPFQPDGRALGLAPGGPALRPADRRLDRVARRGRAHEGDRTPDEAAARRGSREPRREPVLLLRRERSGRRGRLRGGALARRRSRSRRARRGSPDAGLSGRRAREGEEAAGRRDPAAAGADVAARLRGRDAAHLPALATPCIA